MCDEMQCCFHGRGVEVHLTLGKLFILVIYKKKKPWEVYLEFTSSASIIFFYLGLEVLHYYFQIRFVINIVTCKFRIDFDIMGN